MRRRDADYFPPRAFADRLTAASTRQNTPIVSSPWMSPGASNAKVPAAQRTSMAMPAKVSKSTVDGAGGVLTLKVTHPTFARSPYGDEEKHFLSR